MHYWYLQKCNFSMLPPFSAPDEMNYLKISILYMATENQNSSAVHTMSKASYFFVTVAE